MSEQLCDSERCATHWPLPDVDLTDLTLFSQGFPMTFSLNYDNIMAHCIIQLRR